MSNLCKTQDLTNVIGLCQTCIEVGGMGVITGRSGNGKTYSLKCFARNEKVIYIECNECMTVRDIIEEIEEAVGLTHTYGSINKGIKNLKQYFTANKGYLLILDEANKLASKHTQKKLESVRAIYDGSELAVIFAGEPILKSIITRFMPCATSRVDLFYDIKGLSKDEVIMYLDGYSFTDEAISEMIKRATNNKNGCFRLLNRTFNNILRIHNGEEAVDIDTVEAASSMMFV